MRSIILLEISIKFESFSADPTTTFVSFYFNKPCFHLLYIIGVVEQIATFNFDVL